MAGMVRRHCRSRELARLLCHCPHARPAVGRAGRRCLRHCPRKGAPTHLRDQVVPIEIANDLMVGVPFPFISAVSTSPTTA